MFGLGPLGNSIKTGILANATIGASVNTAVQISGDDPFSYVDVVMATVTAAAATGKRFLPAVGINMGGAAIGSAAKRENALGAVIGAGVGSAIGGKVGTFTKDAMTPIIKKPLSDIMGAVTGGYVSEQGGVYIKDKVDDANVGRRK
jgi:filamentous hemagglutinin